MATLLECIAENLNKSVDDLVGTTQIKADLVKLTSQVSQLALNEQTSFSAINAQLATLTADLNNLESEISAATVTAAIASFQTQIDALNLLVNTNDNTQQTQLTQAQTDIINLQSQLNSIITQLVALTTKVNSRTSFGFYSVDSDFTAIWGTTPAVCILNPSLTATRTISLDTVSAVNGAIFRFVNKSTGGFNWEVSTLKTLGSNKWVEVGFDSIGLTWFVVGYGDL